MKRTSNEELNTWRFDQKRAPVSFRINGDHAVAQLYMGEAKALLWSVKNAIGINKLMRGEGERTFKDGTRISAKSIFGQDIIEIDTSKSTLLAAGIGPESCTITFINLPLSVPPMRHPGIIDGAPGVDYFKTYYSFDVNKCPTCQEIAWDLLFTYSKPFEARHYKNPLYDNRDEPDNHSVYSLEPPCWAEILDHGQDGAGYFIIWKAYTEMGDVTFSRTGLGIMLLTAAISNASGVLCSQQAKVDVDCCKKTDDLRKVEIWWEGIQTCQPFIIYGDVHICKAPVSMPYTGTGGLVWYACTQPQQPFYAIPEIKGSCLPVKWTLTGPIEFWGSKENDNLIFVKCLSAKCNDVASIKLEDRCGNFYLFTATPGCQEAAPLEISYTSLQMSCSQQQQFGTNGGCGIKTWSCGTGTITQDGLYTAPATNGDCVNNDTVSVSDECGNGASCQIAVNCYTQSGTAFSDSSCNPCGGCWCLDPNNPPYYGCDQGIVFCGDWIVKSYDCSGILTSSCETRPCGEGNPPCNGNTNGWHQMPGSCGAECGDCWTNQCGGTHQCGQVDVRSDAMKAAGCCPINPLTGLPF